MGLGRRLVKLVCHACAACAMIFIVITFPIQFSGKPVCIPGLSIQCYESDCGSYFQRCGSDILHQVPAGKVCAQGVLLPARRTDLHSCLSTMVTPLNATQRGACSSNCGLCNYPQNCDCLCNTASQSTVRCGTKTYKSQAVANCCGAKSCSRVVPSVRERLWGVLVPLFEQCKELFAGQWFLQSVASSFTFPEPLSDTSTATSCCSPTSGSCSNVCSR